MIRLVTYQINNILDYIYIKLSQIEQFDMSTNPDFFMLDTTEQI